MASATSHPAGILLPYLLVTLLLLPLLHLREQVACALPSPAVKALLLPLKDGSYGSVEDTFYAVSVLEITKDPSLSKQRTCEWASKQALGDASSASALARLAALVCSSAPGSLAEAEGVLLRATGEAASLHHLYLGLGGLATLKAKGWLKSSSADLSQATSAAVKLLEGLKLSDGTWKASSSSSSSSLLATGYALKSLAALLSLEGAFKSLAKDLTKNMRQLFDQAAPGEGKELRFEGALEEGGPVPATALVAAGFLELAEALDTSLQVSKSSVAGLGFFLGSAGAPLSLLEASLLFSALKAFETNSVAVPLVVSSPGQFSVSSNSPAPQVSVTTLLGTPVVEGVGVRLEGARATLKGSSSGKKLPSSALGQTLVKEGSSFLLPPDILGSSSAPGKYSLSVQVTASDAAQVPASPTTLAVVVTTRVSFSPVSIAVLDSDRGEPEAEAKVELSAPGVLPSLSASHLQKLRVSLSCSGPGDKAFVPHQAFLTLRHESGVELGFLLSPVSESSGDLSLKLDLLESLEKLFYLSGIYQLTLTLGDAFMENSGTWALGTLDLDLPEAPQGVAKPPAPAPTLAQRFSPKNEIAHIFRIPDRRPPLLVSYSFTVLALVPLLLLVVGWRLLGVNLKLFPASGPPFVAALAFHGGIGAIVALYFAFWLQVQLFTTLKALILLSLVTAVPGHFILSFLSDSTAKVKAA